MKLRSGGRRLLAYGLILALAVGLPGCSVSSAPADQPIGSEQTQVDPTTVPAEIGSGETQLTAQPEPGLTTEPIDQTDETQATPVAPTTADSIDQATPTPEPAGLSVTNWTITEQGSILWYEPAPKPIAYRVSKIITVTIPEGYTLVDICKLLEKKGVQTFYHLFSAALSGDYPSYGFIETSKAQANRRYALEGYLFPDTYQFHVGESPNHVWAKFLSNTNAVLAGYTPPAGMTMDQTITLASLIEEEAFTGDTRANVSSVLHNRLNSGKRLELDKSINYVEWYIKPLIQSSNINEINAYNSFYNTYKCPALPAGPITNPGRLAIEAAISPAQTNYLYFVTDEAGNYYYAATWEEHLANLKTAGLT